MSGDFTEVQTLKKILSFSQLVALLLDLTKKEI